MWTARQPAARYPRRAGWLLKWLPILAMAQSLFAVNPNLSLGQYLHTSWTQEEGNLLPPIRSIAQTADGYLWLGHDHGLMRFDGIRLVDWPPAAGPPLPNASVAVLHPASGGGLWVALATGLFRIDHGRVVTYPALAKLPCPLITYMLEDGANRLWLLSQCPGGDTLAYLSSDGGLQTFGTADGLPDQPLHSLFQGPDRDLLLVTPTAICQWSPGRKAACSPAPTDNVSGIVQVAPGKLLFTDNSTNRIYRFFRGQTVPVGPRIPNSAFFRAILRDRDGNIWVGTSGKGLLRVRENGFERFTRAEGLSDNTVDDLMEDSEGDIWVATAGGVDRIRDPKAQLYSRASGLSSDLVTSVVGSADGAVWVGSAGGLTRLDGAHATIYSRQTGLPSALVTALYEDAGKLWIATAGGIGVLRGDRFQEVLTEAGEHLQRTFNMAANGPDGIWLADTQRGLFVVRNGVAHPVREPGTNCRDIVSLLVARNGDVWIGHQKGGITVLAGGAQRNYTARDGLGAGLIRSLYEDREGNIWAGSAEGLSRFRGGHWTTWTSAQGLPPGGVQGIIGGRAGALWLRTPAGIMRLDGGNLDAAAKTLSFVLVGRAEGLRLSEGMTNPRIALSRDGRIWTCTDGGAAAIDPGRLQPNPVPPPVTIEQVIADNKSVDPNLRSEAGFRGRDLQFFYTAISLMVPERVRFRYRLEGRDGDSWTEAGTRRNVSYTNLPPGRYRFQVIACNNDSLWNTSGADFSVRVIPYFYQTWWFVLLCGAALLLLGWSAHRLNVRRLVSHMQLIADERVRFSRELHDSLLQGFTGVVFQLEAAERLFEHSPERAKEQLDRAVDQADRSLREARDMITNMRIPALEKHHLAQALPLTIGEMVAEKPVHFRFEIQGHERPGPYNVEANLFLLAREAVNNALKHASPGHVVVQLSYTPAELRLTVEDDGPGFDPEAAMEKPDHWGFRGMRERARLLNARFAVESAPGKGTRIVVTVPWKK